MAKDFKNAPKAKDKPRGGGKGGGFPGWGWFVLGIVVCVAVLKGWPLLLQAGEHANKGLLPGSSSTARSPAPGAASHTPAAAATTQTHFDFYKMLPAFQVVIPGQDKDVRTDDTTAPVKEPGTYVLQVGSFRTFAEADKLKANLALLGIESSIQEVQVNDGATYNRVRIGPLKDLKELNSVRAKLAQNHIQPLVMHVSP
jgi:cell division protein FtsN